MFSRRGTKVRAAIATTSAIALSMGVTASASGQGQFGSSVLRGVRIDAPPRTLWSDPTILTGERICAGIDRLRPAVGQTVNLLVDEINNELRQRVSGLLLVRHVASVSQRCSARAIYVPGAVYLELNLPQNEFTSNVTIPAGIFWRQSMDPRLAMRFDVEVRIRVPLPGAGGQCLGAPSAEARVRNIQLPQGRNITGDIVAAGIDVGSSVYDKFNNGRLGLMLARGVRWQDTVPVGFVEQANQHLCRSGVPYRAINTGFAPGEQLVLSLGTGATVTDNRCIDGYVWRGARQGDDVCVRPEARARVQYENRAHSQRVQPFDPRVVGARACVFTSSCPPSPPQPCLPGYVWRAAVANDYICVPPASRALAAQENAYARRLRRDYETPVQ